MYRDGKLMKNPANQPSAGKNPPNQPSGGKNPANQPSAGKNPPNQPSGGPERDNYRELHIIIIGHDRTHLSIDALDQDNMTCCVTAFTYSRSLRALKALVRYRNTCGQYHASASHKMQGQNINSQL